MHSGGVPGISNSNRLTFEEAGTQTLRVNIIPKKFFRRYAKTKFRVLLGVKRDPEKPYHTSVDSGQMITVVRAEGVSFRQMADAALDAFM